MEIPPYALVESQSALEDLCRHLGSEPVVACDLEADSLHHYREKICLLQFSTPAGTWLVDPLVPLDLSPLRPFFADPSIRKVFHGADYDIRSLHRDFGIEVENLFDTVIAAQFLGIRDFGLAALLSSEFGVTLDKRHQTADWSRRPLPREMLDYAALDTHHLIPLYRRFLARLDGWRSDAVLEESAILSRVRSDEGEGLPLFLRVRGSGRLKGVNLAVLEELLQWRDREARRRDRPPFKVIGSEHLLAIAEKLPRTAEGLAADASLPKKLVDRYAPPLLESVTRGMESRRELIREYERLRRPARGEEKEKRVLAALKEWRAGLSGRLGIDPGVLFPNGQLERLAVAAQPPPVADILKEWQRSLFGEELERMVTSLRQGGDPPRS